MSRLIHKSPHVSVLLYHVVCVAKYRRVIFDEDVAVVWRAVCLDIALRFEIEFLEIGLDGDHVHFLVQSVPTYSPTKIVTLLQSLIAREIFAWCPQVKKKLWGGECWSDGYFIVSVGQQESEETVRRSVKQQGHDQSYRQLHTQKAAGQTHGDFLSFPVPVAATQSLQLVVSPRGQGLYKYLPGRGPPQNVGNPRAFALQKAAGERAS